VGDGSNTNINSAARSVFSMGPLRGGSGSESVLRNHYNARLALSAPTVATGQLFAAFPNTAEYYSSIHTRKSNYRSLQASFMKRFGGKGILSVAYTWSHLMSNTDSSSAFLDEGFIFGGSTQDNNHLNHEYSVSSYDVPQNLAVGLRC